MVDTFALFLSTLTTLSLVGGVIVLTVSSIKKDNRARQERLSRQEVRAEKVRKGALKEVSAPINLHRDEKCYYIGNANLVRLRTTRARGYYQGVSARVKIAKGVYYRAGYIGGGASPQESWLVVDTGMVIVTSERIVFRGEKENDSVDLKKVLSINYYPDESIRIDKDRGRPLIMNNCEAVVINAVVKKLSKKNSKVPV